MTDRRIWITIETERMLVIARRHALRGWCERCGTEIEFLPLDQVRRQLDTTSGRVLEQHRNNLHRWLAKDGLILVCVKSLLRFLQSASGQRVSKFRRTHPFRSRWLC
jgi:hypothetical protein